MLVGILGILKSGSAYVPLDPIYPKERIQHILNDSGAPIVLTEKMIANDLPEFAGKRIVLDEDWPAISQEPAVEPQASVTPNNLAYVLFTSGSTGRPKGVAIEHRSAATFVHWAQQVFNPQELAGVLLSTSICFDLSVFEMFVPLSVGGKVIIANNALFLPSLAGRNEVTLINTVPSAMAELLRMNGVPDSVTTVNLAGEALPDILVEQIYAGTKAERVYNLYGPTEDTTYSTFKLVRRGTTVTVGKPVANSQAYILNTRQEPVPIGVPGELYLAGEGLARGYYGRPDLTCERFVPDPQGATAGARMYRTGDLARFLPDGNIDYLGRIDHQVKLRGFRIELGEIETVLLEDPGVDRAVVVVREDRPGEKQLVGYVVPKAGTNLDSATLRNRLELSVPGYMIPAAFVTLEALPMTGNGKINRRALPAPDWSRVSTEARTAPTDQLEIMLIRIWERVLGIAGIHVDDNFFDLGGHSLLAVRLLSEVEKVVGRKVPLASLFRGSTVASQAKLLREGTEANPEPLVMEYQAGRTGTPPFFAVATPGVRSLGYALLARNLGENQPFFKLQAQAPVVQGRPLNWGELRALAHQYVAGMRAVQPEGPYYLVAMCGGCQIAEQMILQLESQGQQVALFAIFDTWVLEHAHRRWGWWAFSYQQRLRWLRKVSLREQVDWATRALDNRVRIWTGKAKPTRPWAEAYWPEDFKPPRFRAPIVLFKRPKQPYYYIDDPLMGWGGRSEGGVITHEINANHHEVLREPHVQFVSKILLEQLAHSNNHRGEAEVNSVMNHSTASASH
jgi:amino acid adenylation domain-containing protein